ncbi:ABC1 kinase family protein [Streptomyces sp. NPDC058045]|uniref:ABC1 kinase family protein n=1 Tax=Streptomyces sp. NPDC058045 TaxID=3346311 RepID=UPI0036ECDFDC
MTSQAVDLLSRLPLVVLVAAVAVVLLLALAVAVSTASRRLLGISVGPLRMLGAGSAGVASLVLYGNLLPVDERDLGALSTLQIPLALLAAMLTLVVLEVFVPYGSWARPWQAVRGLGDRVRRTRRSVQISRVFMRNGLGRVLRGRGGWDRAMRPGPFGEQSARSARIALEECGGAMIKLGQLLSTRRDLLPPHFIEELSRLQSEVPPAPWPEVEAVLRKELGRPVAEVFAGIDRVPLAAASVAQVHRARLRDGSTVVVKIQRPGVRETVERDLSIVLAISRGLQGRVRSAQALGLRELGDGFAQSLREELDFRVEARNSLAVARATGGYAERAGVRIPRVHSEYTSARVLVQEWLEGVTFDRAAATAEREGYDRQEAARTVFAAMLHQILEVGVFHADPHPGNLLLLADGRVGLIDFGSVGRIDASARLAIRELLLAVDRGDPAGLHDALLTLLGTRATRHEDTLPGPLLERELGRFMAVHLGPDAQPDTEMFTALFRTLTRFALSVPPEIAAVFRALATVEGTLTRLAPEFHLLQEARSFAVGSLTGRFRPGASGSRSGGAEGASAAQAASSLLHGAAQELLQVLPMMRRLPRRAERISAALEEGRLGVRVRVLADERERHFVSGLIHQVTISLTGACLGLMGVMLLVFGTGKGPHVTRHVELYPVIGYHLLAFSAILMLRALYTALRHPG